MSNTFKTRKEIRIQINEAEQAIAKTRREYAYKIKQLEYELKEKLKELREKQSKDKL